MEKTSAVAAALCLVVLLGGSYASAGTLPAEFRGQRGLLSIPTLDDVYAACQTSASAVLIVTSGTGRVRANSKCEAYAQSISSIQEIWQEYLIKIRDLPKDTCKVVEIEKVLHACATAIATVYAEAFASVYISGTGRGCARAFAEGDAYATAYAALFVNLWLGVTDGPNFAEAEALVATLEFAIAEAWAKAEAGVCQVNTGSAVDYERSFAAQVQVALACVFAEVAVKFCKHSFDKLPVEDHCDVCNNGELSDYYVKTESEAEVGVCSTTFDPVNVSRGNASTGNKDPVPCEGNKKTCCDSFYADVDVCRCGRKCHLTRYLNALWQDKDDGSVCFCTTGFP